MKSPGALVTERPGRISNQTAARRKLEPVAVTVNLGGRHRNS
jgi:hypothetical protein